MVEVSVGGFRGICLHLSASGNDCSVSTRSAPHTRTHSQRLDSTAEATTLLSSDKFLSIQRTIILDGGSDIVSRVESLFHIKMVLE